MLVESVVETLEVNAGKLVTDSDVSQVFSIELSLKVGAVNMSDVVKGMLVTLKEEEVIFSFEEDVAREMLPD